VPQNYEKAAFSFRRAAELGDARAQLELGNLHSEGKGVPQDYTQAAFWYRKAAEQGYAPAQSILGSLYDTGQGVSQAYAEAYFWYALAATKSARVGSSVAKLGAEVRDKAASHLTPAELAREQERARKWIESHGGEARMTRYV
jgi:TPR repeat protein